MEKEILNNEPLNFEKVWFMYQETDKKFQETDKKFQETDKKFQETERLLNEKFRATEREIDKLQKIIKSTNEELGGIGKSNGKIAEDLFYRSLEKSMQVGELKFDFIDKNTTRKRNGVAGEYDIILYNEYKILVVEVKYIFRMKYLDKFYNSELKNFKTLYSEYSNYKIYGAIAAMSFEEGVIEAAEEYGFYILTQNNKTISLLNNVNFEPININENM